MTTSRYIKREAFISMETPTLTHISTLKKKLAYAIAENHYDLLSPEVLLLSEELDRLMIPLFTQQIENNRLTNHNH